MSIHEAEARVAAYFARQYGVITVQQAHDAGLTDRMIEYRVANGRWVRLASGLYAVASAPPDWQRDLAAALLLHTRPSPPGSRRPPCTDFRGYAMPGPRC